MQLFGVLGNVVSNSLLVVLMELFLFFLEDVYLLIWRQFRSLIADDQWDAPLTFPAHDSSVNSVSWASLHSGNDYFVPGKIKFYI